MLCISWVNNVFVVWLEVKWWLPIPGLCLLCFNLKAKLLTLVASVTLRLHPIQNSLLSWGRNVVSRTGWNYEKLDKVSRCCASVAQDGVKFEQLMIQVCGAKGDRRQRSDALDHLGCEAGQVVCLTWILVRSWPLRQIPLFCSGIAHLPNCIHIITLCPFSFCLVTCPPVCWDSSFLQPSS